MADASSYTGTELEAMSLAVNYHRWIRDEFRPYLGDSVAEVGAGVGDFSTLLLELPIEQPSVFEPAKNLFPVLEKKLSERDEVRLTNDVFSPDHLEGSVDSVVYVNVLEHIEDDFAEIRLAYQALKPGGHLLIFVPALQWLYSPADRELGHFRRYHKKPLKNLAEKAGFSILEIKYFDVAGIIPWWFFFVVLKRPFRKAPVSTYDRFVVPVMRRLEGLVVPPIGKNLLLVARKDG